MEGFKTNPKMAKNLPCYKEGGAVYKSRHSEKKEMSEDVAQDKKIIKKAFSMHDKQEHKGEHTDLSKLKKGGRTKKDCGTVRKYKAGGGVYGAKKTDADIKSIDKAKKFKPEMLCGGKSVNKYSGEFGSYVTPTEQKHAKARYLEEMRLDPKQQIEFAAQKAAAGAQFTKNEADRLNKVSEGIGRPNVDQMNNPTGMKKGGKTKKACS
jgi:hypothetical protein